MFTSYLLNAARDFSIDMSEQQLEQFNRYFKLLIEWNEKINLTAITEPKEVAIKHMIDSISCYDSLIFAKGCSIIDVGTGAGFPGLPLKILYPDIKLTLVDSLNKRVNFLRDVIEQLGLTGVEVFHARAEEFARKNEHREKYDIAVSRAVARLNVLCELCLPFVKVNGHFIALKGAQFEQEIAEAEHALHTLGADVVIVRPIKLPELEDTRAVIYIKKTRSCPKLYPRKPGTPEKKPL